MNGGDDAFVAEVMSCREALSWLKKNNYDNIISKFDALNVVNALNNHTAFSSPIKSSFNDCLQLM